jgi:nucleoside-diphosphate-sugar epimerase
MENLSRERKVLITGHQGFIGPVVIKQLKEAGYYTIGADIGYFKECTSYEDTFAVPDVEINADLRAFPYDILDEVGSIVHLAGLSNDPIGDFDPDLTHEINLESSKRLSDEAKLRGVERFLFASSCSIYGKANNIDLLDETSAFNPVSAYAKSKVEFEYYLNNLASDSFSPVFLRNSTAYGVSNRTRIDLVVNNLIGWAVMTGKINILSDGKAWRPIVHIEDIAHANICVLNSSTADIHNEAFNIGRLDCNYSVFEIAQKINQFFPECSVNILGKDKSDPRSYKVDFNKSHQRLNGFKPSWSLEKGIDQIKQWYASIDLEEDLMTSRKYIRLQQLKHLIYTKTINNRLEFK